MSAPVGRGGRRRRRAAAGGRLASSGILDGGRRTPQCPLHFEAVREILDFPLQLYGNFGALDFGLRLDRIRRAFGFTLNSDLLRWLGVLLHRLRAVLRWLRVRLGLRFAALHTCRILMQTERIHHSYKT